MRVHLKKEEEEEASSNKTMCVKSFKRVYQSMREELKVREGNERERE